MKKAVSLILVLALAVSLATVSSFFGASADGAAGVFTGAVAVTCGFASPFFF